MAENSKKVGEMLIEDGTISPKTLERALERSRKEHKKVELIPEEMGGATGDQIADVFGRQFG